ncbi:hypothetical protein [Streptomyces sp. NBC_01760]|uniref:hypothetical protein n=1 Tax=Streptomyces sp. NBC_01760 TaxID=2975931 RepID=UPI002DD8A8FD|nr:hypothetical protein [Streptomyces sp. NBC_01760]WSC72229.1 hypothetical protein OG807_29185 [Streptomyces sp. NBC_01760]
MKTLPPVGSGEPTFIFDQPDRGMNRFAVFGRAAHWNSDVHLGFVYETAGAGWVADWSKSSDQPEIAMAGFLSKENAASALYWFEPPERSMRSTQWHRPTDTWVNGTVSFRGESAEAAATALNRAAGALLDGAASWTDTTATTYDVQITANNN